MRLRSGRTHQQQLQRGLFQSIKSFLAMLPTYERLNAPRPVIKIAFGKLAVGTVSLPFFGFFFCVIWSLVNDFEGATFTHCDVRNYLPSISAAIGSYEPQKTVWRLAICLHLPIRLVITKMYLEYYREHIRRNRRHYVNIACALNVVENLSLLCLSIWTSADDYDVHRNAFVTFIACSEMYMLISYFLNKYGHKTGTILPIEEKSVRYKRDLCIVNVASFSLAGYFFLRHNAHCEPGIYTLFALFEYIVVLTNMAYHMTAYWDFYSLYVNFDWKSGLYLSRT